MRTAHTRQSYLSETMASSPDLKQLLLPGRASTLSSTCARVRESLTLLYANPSVR